MVEGTPQITTVTSFPNTKNTVQYSILTANTPYAAVAAASGPGFWVIHSKSRPTLVVVESRTSSRIRSTCSLCRGGRRNMCITENTYDHRRLNDRGKQISRYIPHAEQHVSLSNTVNTQNEARGRSSLSSHSARWMVRTADCDWVVLLQQHISTRDPPVTGIFVASRHMPTLP